MFWAKMGNMKNGYLIMFTVGALSLLFIRIERTMGRIPPTSR